MAHNRNKTVKAETEKSLPETAEKKYTVISDITIMHSGTAYCKGDIIPLSEEYAKKLDKYISEVTNE